MENANSKFENHIPTSVGFQLNRGESAVKTTANCLKNDEVLLTARLIDPCLMGRITGLRQLTNIGLTRWRHRQNCMLIVVNTRYHLKSYGNNFTQQVLVRFLPLCNHQTV